MTISKFEKNYLLEEYLLYDLYHISIYYDSSLNVPIYVATLRFNKDLEFKYIKRKIKSKLSIMASNFDFLNITDKKYSFNEVLKKIIGIIYEDIGISNNFKFDKFSMIPLFFVFELLGIEKFLPYLLDDHVTEIYVDRPDSTLYIDHDKFGRCNTSVVISHETSLKFKNIVELENNLSLDYHTPSIKGDIITDFFRVRVAIDSYPLTVDGPAIDIRKYRLRPFTLTELINLGTLTPLAAAFMIFLLKNKINIVIIGRPASGKTTLANALDLLTPKSWRKIYIEDVIESINQINMERHQLRLRVDSSEGYNSETMLRKSNEIIKLLHRNPDWIFLGEVLTKDHSNALFHALVSGITGIETYHAASPFDAVVRWNTFHNIPYYVMQNLGLIVHMKKIIDKRFEKIRIFEICEISLENSGHIPISFNTLFRYSIQKDELILLKDNLFNESLILQKIHRETGINENAFFRTLNAYEKTINELIGRGDFSLRSLYDCITKIDLEG